MITSDRRRAAAASIFTVVALPALWVLNRESATTSSAPKVGAAGVEVVADAGANTVPATEPYQPQPPSFVGGDEQPDTPDQINVAIPPAPGANQVVAEASFKRYSAGSRQCTTLLAPDGALLTVENIDNGQTTTCTNTLGMAIPAGADIVLHTDVFGEIGDLADAPVPVRVSW
ncbi:MAG: hypothetical protein ABMA25_06755 [Ilumatobacteraceae bacterium]